MKPGNKIPPPSPSRLRSLVRDACQCLRQQMGYWGCDTRHPAGNLLVRFGMHRIERIRQQSEGSSRYRMAWRDGLVELHSFCAGWYSPTSDGAIFIRNRERLYTCSGFEPLTPGCHDERTVGVTSDGTLAACHPLLEWLLSYERWVEAQPPSDYRQRCWMKHLPQMGIRTWLPPAQTTVWLEKFLTDPASTPRARELLRPRGPSGTQFARHQFTASSKSRF